MKGHDVVKTEQWSHRLTCVLTWVSMDMSRGCNGARRALSVVNVGRKSYILSSADGKSGEMCA